MVFSKCYDRSFFNIAYSGGFKSAAIGLFKYKLKRPIMAVSKAPL